jgi:hypothetical protein
MKPSLFCFAVVMILIMTGCTSPQEEKSTLFTKLASAQTRVTFVNTNKEDEKNNILSYEYFYNGGGVALGDINNDGLVDIYFSANQAENKLYLNKGNFQFDDITAKAGVAGPRGWRTGVVMVDINDDGFLDIYVCRSGPEHPIYRSNLLFVNNGNLTFTEKAKQYGLDDASYSTHAAFFDFDNDHDLDMFLLNHSRLTISNSYDISRRYDNKREKYAGNKLYRNDGGKFNDVSDSLGIFGPASNYGLGIAYTDMDGDGWTDIFTTNDYTEKDKYYINRHGHSFVDASDSLLTHMAQFSMGVDIADVNNDGHYDLFSVDMLPADNKRQKEFFWPDKYDVFETRVKNGRHYQYMRNVLQLNNGNGTFSEIGQFAGISNTDWSWAPLFADFDNDGLQDLFVTNGFKRNFTSNDFQKFGADKALKERKGGASIGQVLNNIPSTKIHNYIFRNINGVSFEDKSYAWGFEAPVLSNGAAYGDLDNDGDLDIVTNIIDEEAGIYRNNAEHLGAHFLRIRLEGDKGNRFGFGASTTVYHSGGKLLSRTLCPNRGFQSSVEPVLTFGLGSATSIDSIIVKWPGGNCQKLVGVKSDQTITAKEKDASVNSRAQKINPIFILQANSLRYKHEENDFIDFKSQILLPRSYSTMGPAIAKVDVNGDGLLDLFTGGAKGQSGSIHIQTRERNFIQKGQLQFESGTEDIDATFVDIDNDKDLDLYVVTGGYEFENNDNLLQDKLYRNDGRGNFQRSALPEMISSGSCVRAADIDQDGDQDLFVGGRIVPGRYPEKPESYILINNGKGTFTIETQHVSPSIARIGLVTDALWLNLNGDQFPDLILTGEWMPVTCFVNEKGKLVDKTNDFFSAETKGWWNCLLAADFDKDGDQDIVAGNFGLNNQYRVTPSRPATLYFSDYDKNGSIDPILNYFIGDESYPAPTRDELVEQIPSFKKRFNDYGSYANATINKVLTTDEIKNSEIYTAQLFESVYIQNDGGKFSIRSLPEELQFAPVFAFETMDVNEDGNLDLIAGGNLSKMGARMGKATANFGSVLIGDGTGNFKSVAPLQHGVCVRGDVRRIIKLNDRLFFFRNNDTPVVYSLKR